MTREKSFKKLKSYKQDVTWLNWRMCPTQPALLFAGWRESTTNRPYFQCQQNLCETKRDKKNNTESEVNNLSQYKNGKTTESDRHPNRIAYY